MKTTLFDSRFIRVAINGLPDEMSQAELDTEFENFQDAMRKLLFSDEGYIAIDFTLNDLLASICLSSELAQIFEHVLHKMTSA